MQQILSGFGDDEDDFLVVGGRMGPASLESRAGGMVEQNH
jgi:hypothetical protein